MASDTGLRGLGVVPSRAGESGVAGGAGGSGSSQWGQVYFWSGSASSVDPSSPKPFVHF